MHFAIKYDMSLDMTLVILFRNFLLKSRLESGSILRTVTKCFFSPILKPNYKTLRRSKQGSAKCKQLYSKTSHPGNELLEYTR